MFAEMVEELVGLTDHELDARIRELELTRRRTESELAAAIAVGDARQLNAVDGHRSMKGYLRATCNWAPGEVSRFRGAAATIDAHPEVGDAWLDGHIGSAQVASLSKVRTKHAVAERFGEFVPLLVEQAERLPLPDFEIVLQRLVHLADADGTLDERNAVEGRTVTATHVDGALFVKASGGDATTTAEFLEILRRFENAEFAKDITARDAAIAAGREIEPFRSGPQRRYDALVTMARCAAQTNGIASPSEPLVSVLVDHQTMSWILAHSGLGAATSLTGESIDPFTGLPARSDLLDDLLGDPSTFLDRRCETTTGVPLRPTDVLRAVLSGNVRRVVLGAKGRVVDLGRSSRVFTGAARDAALLLTTTCEHAGCDVPAAWCQVDHSIEWHELGETNQENSGGRCPGHNKDKHRQRRRTRRANDGRMYTFRTDGTIMLPVGCRPPRFEPDDDLDEPVELTPEEERMLDEATRARVRLLTPARPC